MPTRDWPVLAFSTLATPGWAAERVVFAARDWGFDGIEWRGGPDGTVRTAWPPARRREIRDRVRDAGLRSIAVTAYTDFVAADPSTVRRSIDAALAHVELARDLAAPTVRVFVGERLGNAPDEVHVARAASALDRLVEAAGGSGVAIAVEPHDDHARSDALLPILDSVAAGPVGVVWDIGNAWAADEDPAAGLAAYEGRIAYVQVKDGTGTGASWRLCALGRGEVPIGRAIGALVRRGGDAESVPISIEWERAWDPRLDLPEIALPAALAWLRATIAAARPSDGSTARPNAGAS